ncbi:MAG: glucose 1-dehydrogenase [Anaerolineales bacterium]|nr:glucose 1-dehydrogenase [Anaerolineales bacterium]
MSSSNMFDLTGKIAMVTGAHQGLGRAIALGLAEAGASLVLADIRDPKSTAREITHTGREALSLKVDVTQLEEIKMMVSSTLQTFGTIDILYNVAGVNIRRPVIEVTQEDWDFIVDVNQKGLFFCCQQVGRIMIQQRRGKIINMASINSTIVMPGVSVYAGTKAAVAHLTKAMALEWAPYNVYVNAIGPGFFKTELGAPIHEYETARSYLEKRIPLGHPAVPKDLQGLAVFLASEASDYITGQLINIDGGWLVGEFVPLPMDKRES